MPKHTLYLACYDIRDPRRLREALKVLRDYALGRQKSVFECPLAGAEKGHLVIEVADVIEAEEDRFALLRLDSRGVMRALGRGVVVEDGDIFYIG